MIGLLARNWGWIALRGAAAILFGILALARPGITLAVLVLFWGAYALIDGVFALVAAFRIRDDNKPMWPLVLVGIIGIAAGVLTLMYPGMTAVLLLMFIAAWAIISGIFQIAAAIRLRKVISNEWMMALSGALSILFGLLLFARPGAGALAVIWTIACFAIVYGAVLLVLAFRLKGLAAHVPKLA